MYHINSGYFAMFLLNHKKHRVRLITDDEARYLQQALTPDTEAFNRQQKILTLWRENRYWVECSCRDNAIPQVDKPVMALRRLPSGLVVFSLLPSSPPHDESCPFYRLARYKTYENGQSLRQDKRRTDFTFHRHAIEKSEDEEGDTTDTENTSSSSSGPSMPGLQRFLYNLAHYAKIHVFTKDTCLEEAKYLYRLTQSAHDFTINKRFRLSDFLYTHIDKRNQAIYRLQATAQHWTGMARPHCVFVFPIDEVIKGDHGVCLRRFRYSKGQEKPQFEDLNLSKECDLIMPGRFILNKQNPALAVVTFADTSQTDVPFFAPAKALVVPVVSKSHLLIVESNYERVIAKALRRYQLLLANRLKTQFFIRVVKPLENLRTPVTRQAVRPDFVLEYQNKKVILEVMGTHDDEYLERKSRLVPLMEEIAPVYEFDAYQADCDNELEGRSLLACRQAIEVLLADDPAFMSDCQQALEKLQYCNQG